MKQFLIYPCILCTTHTHHKLRLSLHKHDTPFLCQAKKKVSYIFKHESYERSHVELTINATIAYYVDHESFAFSRKTQYSKSTTSMAEPRSITSIRASKGWDVVRRVLLQRKQHAAGGGGVHTPSAVKSDNDVTDLAPPDFGLFPTRSENVSSEFEETTYSLSCATELCLRYKKLTQTRCGAISSA